MEATGPKIRLASSYLLASLGLVCPLLSTTALSAEDWPQLLGPGRNGVSNEEPPVPWPESGPPSLWSQDVGEGFSAPVVAQGRLILFHRTGRREVVDCFDAESGKRLWSYHYSTSYRDDFGFDEGPRGTPTISAGRVLTFGAQGVLSCLDLASGKEQWQVDTHRKFGVRKGFFGAATSPLVDGERVLLNVGGRDGAGIVAFDQGTGETLWSSTDDEASYSSAVAATLNGARHSLFLTRQGLVALDPENGAVKFRYPWRARAQASVNAATPLVVGNRIFLSASYQTGAVLLEVDEATPRQIWSSRDALSNHYATSVYHDGYLYGFHGRQEYGPSLRCVELTSGKVQWSVDRFGGGTVTRIKGHLLVLREDGTLILAPASPEGFRSVAQSKILSPTVRAYPAFAAGRLYARNDDELVCVGLPSGE